jgi:hypothetical protein
VLGAPAGVPLSLASGWGDRGKCPSRPFRGRVVPTHWGRGSAVAAVRARAGTRQIITARILEQLCTSRSTDYFLAQTHLSVPLFLSFTFTPAAYERTSASGAIIRARIRA